MIAIEVAKDGSSFDCKNCKLGRHCDEDKIIEGSKGPANYERYLFKEIGFSSRVCPLPLVTAKSTQFIRLYKSFDKGVLVKSGGLIEQPNQYIEAMEIIGRHA